MILGWFIMIVIKDGLSWFIMIPRFSIGRDDDPVSKFLVDKARKNDAS
jgi:hypothetical protein